MAKSRIPWTDGPSWNPVSGCTPCSPGCKNCYAERMAYRFWEQWGHPEPPRHFDVTLHPDRLLAPLRWRKTRRVFPCATGDLFHPDVPDTFIDRVFAVMATCPQHTFMLLTKRAQRMMDYFNRLGAMTPYDRGEIVWRETLKLVLWADGDRQHEYFHDWLPWPLPNVWLGATCCNQAEVHRNIPLLLKTSAKLRFVSLEPMLGPVRLDRLPAQALTSAINAFTCDYYSPWSGEVIAGPPSNWGPLDWVILGCESRGRRPGRTCELDWARGVRDQCTAAGVPLYIKQLEIDGKLVKMPKLDGRVHDAIPEVASNASE